MSLYKHILLVDDDDDDRSVFVETMADIYPEVFCSVAQNGHRALQHLTNSKSKPGLIFLDINMPVMNGREFLRTIKNDWFYRPYKDIPVIMLTTATTGEEDFLKMGAHLFITKPTSVHVCRSLLSTILACDFAQESALLSSLIAQSNQASRQQH
jgi:CheY-like chemotaxis protein